jgi:type II secretory pathway component PulF
MPNVAVSFGWFSALLAIAGWLVVFLAVLGGVLSFGYSLLSDALNRRQRASFFLDLVETGLAEGRRTEETIVSISASRDASLGLRFHLLAAYLEQGLPFRHALESVPGILPRPIVAMLKAGLTIGDLQKVLPACRQMLNDAISQSCGAVNYLVAMLFFTTPVCFMIWALLKVLILPKFTEVAAYMDASPPAIVVFLTAHSALFPGALFLVILVCGSAATFGSTLESNNWFVRFLNPLRNRISYSLPWRRKRMQRDFSSMLAILLDAGVPESEALQLAGDCTANDVFRKRVARARAGLAQGLKLAQAVEIIDDSGEFRWRLTQAIGRQGGFVEAIAGWKESLDARAFQQEQATAQIATTALVLLNGVFVATIALSIFGMLISIINAGLLW